MDPHHSTEEEFPEHISMSSAGTKESDVASRSANGVGMEDFEDNPASPMSRNSKAASKLIRTRRDKGRSTHASVHSVSSADPDDRSAMSIDTRDTTPPSANNPRIGAAPRLPPSPMSDVSRDYLIMPEASEKEADQSHLASGTVGSASPTALRCLRRIRANRKRVPGGAAAKLIGRSVDGGKYEGDSHMEHYEDDEDVEIEPPTDELHELRRKAKEEFARGSTSNRRYHEPERYSTEDNGKAMSEASLPSILNRSEAFHESATAAVISLLAPKQAHDLGSVVSPKSCLEDAPAFVNIPPVSAFQPPIRGNRDDASVITPAAGNGDGEDRYEHAISSARSPLAQPLLSRKAEERVEEMARQMKDPSKTLSDLLSAIASPDNGDLNRGYMVRRKNACGALQVLTAKNVHRVQICWTIGVLPVLTSVLEDAGDNGPDETFPDISTRREYLEARKRAIASLMNLSMPTDNRLAVFHSPRLIASVVDVIKEDEGESRRGCCAVLGYLAKTSENRLLMVQVPGLLSVITDVIKPKKSPEQENPEPAGKMYNYDSSASEEDDAIDTISSTDASVASPEEEKKQEKADAKRDPSTVEDSGKAFAPYDEDPNQYLHGARQNVFALLGHLLKEKDNAYHLARHKELTNTLVHISQLHESPSHVLAVKLLAHLTRHRANSKNIVFKLRNVVPAFVKATYSDEGESRKYACFGIQNLAQDKPCRQELAVTQGLVSALCIRARLANDGEERLAAIHALKNLTDEPANLIPMTNTPECFATLMQIAHASDESVTEMMQYLGCDALATLSHWFRSIATSGQRIEAVKRKQIPSKDLFVPTLKIVTYEQWQ